MDNLAPFDGELFLIASFFPGDEAGRLFDRLLVELKWEEESLYIAGKEVKAPRLVCWYGDKGASYTYSGVNHPPMAWIAELKSIKKRIEDYCGRSFNSVLGNLYRDGRDSMGWHADREKELGVNPFIASLSLGDERLFKIRHNKSGEALDFSLRHGDLLLMGGSLQHHWRHCVPKTRQEKKPRINLTFRKMICR